MSGKKIENRNPWAWVSTLYYAEGIPYVIVMTVSVIMYKRLGISNTDIALYTSWLYLPWVIKPLWSPIVDLLKTKRFWIIIMQLIIGAGLAGVALTIPLPNFFQYTLAFLWLLAFSSATHDIAADGFYMLGLDKHQQAFFVGVRSTFYRLAMITGQGLLIILAGYFESATGLEPVEMTVRSKLAPPAVEVFDPASMLFNELDGELRIISGPATPEISTAKIQKQMADSLISAARTWNIQNGFYQEEKPVSSDAGNDDEGVWTRYISGPLSQVLSKYFGPEMKEIPPSDKNGNVAYLFFALSKPPSENEEIVMNFGLESGDKSINIVEGTRFSYTSKNWNKPALAVIQLDPKLNTVTEAGFNARSGNIPLAWIITFSILGGMFVVFFVYHKIILPYPKIDQSVTQSSGSELLKEFFRTFALFFKKERIGVILTFLLVYRLGESQLVKLASPFMLDPKELGGLGLTTGDVGLIYGTIGILALTLGGLLGGFVAAKHGLKYWLWWMVLAINLPNLVYVYLSYTLPDSFIIISLGVAVEQFGYGFGFTAYMLFMIYVSDGNHKTAHYAITTGFMALGMMIPGMISGWLQDIIGYQHFFVWVVIATIPSFVITRFIPVDAEFGKKSADEK